MADRATRRRARRRITVWSAIALAAGVVAFLVWCSIDYDATPDQYAAVTDDPALVVSEESAGIVIRPASDADASEVGLVFVPGAKVTAEAYAEKLSGLAQSGVTVVITRPVLNLAFFDLRPLAAFTDLVPSVETWYVGGHSLGGVKACQFAGEQGVDGLILLGSYCASDLSADDLRVLSVSASEDGLSTPDDIEASAEDLPADAMFVEIEGANHAQFGDYGPQPGDGEAAIGHGEVSRQLTDALTDFMIDP